MSINFGNLPKVYAQYKNARIVVLPIPFDKSVSWQKGAAKGPQAILAASSQVELYDIDTETEVYTKGIFTHSPIKAKTSQKMITEAYQKITKFLHDQKFVVSVGGDHSVAIGPIFAHSDFFQDISVLHLDAHADMRDSYHNNKFSHASVMARARSKVSNIVSVGIRSMDLTERSAYKAGELFLAKDMHDNKKSIAAIVKKLTKKVYLSLDVDVFDSGIMPATGTPEPGGLDWYQVTNLLQAVCQNRELIGMDIVELAPNVTNKAPDYLVAKLIYKILSYKFRHLA